jgi:hypothetical protein
MLIELYPEYPWIMWLFEMVPRGFWDDESNHKKFLDWFGDKHNIDNASKWYSIKREQIDHCGGSTLVGKYGNSLSRYIHPKTTFAM